MSQHDAAVSIRDARKAYKTFTGAKRSVVDGVSIQVAPGTIHGLLGPNGAGKTTTVKMLLGLVRPDEGVFEVLGRDTQRAGGRASIGFLPEQPYFPPQLKASGAMRLYGRLAGVDRSDLVADVDRLLDRVGLGRHGQEQLSKFSRGMLQRLGIAQAMLGGPHVLILDEPASGLDPVGQRDVRNLMLELREAGTTVLLSSHQLSEVEAVCDRVSILNQGRVAAEGHIDDLLNVEGQTSVRASGLDGGLPESVASLAKDVAASGGAWVFSIADEDVRTVVDALDDAGGRIVSVSPKRESLEDYFAMKLTDEAFEEVAS